MIEVIFKIFLTDYIDFQRFITKRIQKPLLIEYKSITLLRTISIFFGKENHLRPAIASLLAGYPR
jgi:hypothetical protein